MIQDLQIGQVDIYIWGKLGMKIDSLGRILGSFLIVTAYFIVLHISATLGALMHLIANIISVPFFIRTKAWDVVIMLSFLMVISLTKVLWLSKYSNQVLMRI